ncbi:hypothetical protein QUW13_03685 [Enterococcus hirae]|jgi:ABC-type bacteriocin/lantibiotic exporter with double-glycine peptidase domain|nr:hypothetical protein [Enterococcaceae bacterium]MCI1920045.1 hypothetical protein [Enterococcaceae bacterium]MDM8212979.1 hypothetical protein [Enterococcus hirae]
MKSIFAILQIVFFLFIGVLIALFEFDLALIFGLAFLIISLFQWNERDFRKMEEADHAHAHERPIRRAS